jgi:iron complex outermembrane receptor protein
LVVGALVDIPEQKGGAIYGASVVGGFGSLDKQGVNLLVSLSVRDNKILRGDQRDFVNTFQPSRGVSPDTRGAPIATVFAINSLYSALSRDNINATGRGTGPVDPANPAQRVNGINVLDLPGQAGCASVDGMGPYDEVLWASPAAKYGCAWDTGRAAVIQQPVKNTNLLARGTLRLGEHHVYAEAVLGRSESAKSFSNNQISSTTLTTTALPNTTRVPHPFLNLAYPSTGASYNEVFNVLASTFPALEANRGRPLAFRWRCMPCGPREITTETDTARYLLGADGPVPFLSGWEYKAGFSQATSESTSLVGSGYHYWVPFAKLLNDGVLNPFSVAQTPQALAALDAISARGVTLYGGKFTMQQADAAMSGPVFKLPAGTVMGAVGVDLRKEKYGFDGDQRSNANTAEALIFNVPFDNALATAGTLKRDIKAMYAELLVPVMKNLEFNAAVRSDEYTGFGRSTNPKVSLRYTPTDNLLIRGAYSTGFRVPTFKQQFDPITEATYAGNDFADPATCPSGVVSSTVPGCAALPANSFTTVFGGKADLQPEEAKLWSLGLVWQVTPDLSANIDWWSIEREGTIQSFGLQTMARNYSLFADRFIRDASGNLRQVDTRWSNAGATETAGLEFGLRGAWGVTGGRLNAAIDVSYLLKKRSRLLANTPFGKSEVGAFTRAGDLGLRWKHTASVAYATGPWVTTVSQTYRAGYLDAVLPGVANGTVRPANWQPKVEPYVTFDASVAYTGIKNLTLIAGIKNLLNDDPPFSVTYDTNTGAGSSWEPRVADPRGRALTLRAEYKFF